MLLLLVALAHAEPSAADLQALLARTAPFRAAREAKAPAIPAADYEQARTGGVATGVESVAGTPAGQLWGVTVFPRAIESVWMAVNDEEAAAPLLPVSTSVVVRGQAHRHGRLIFEFLPISLATDRWWVAEQHHNAALYRASAGLLWELAWTTVDGDPVLTGTPQAAIAAEGQEIAWAKGAWLLIPVDATHTLGEYFTWSDPGGSIPAGVSRFGRGEVDRTLQALGQLAGRYSTADRARFVRPDGASFAGAR